MTKAELQDIIDRVKGGLDIEDTHLDLKKEWWNLADKKDKKSFYEFLKDICSMANTKGENSHIIIGLDEKTGELFDSPIPLNEAAIQQKHKEQIEPPVNLIIQPFSIPDGEQDKNIFVVKIPHSKNRPHVIKKFLRFPKKGEPTQIDNYTPIRFGSSTDTATKTDLDEMYAERRPNDKPLKITLIDNALRWANYAIGYKVKHSFSIKLTIDNLENSGANYIENAYLEDKGGTNWKTAEFAFEEHGLDPRHRIDPKPGTRFRIEAEHKHDVALFLLVNPFSHDQPEFRPNDFDHDQLYLILQPAIGDKIEIEIKPGWIC